MNRASPEMMHCLNLPGNIAGNSTDMTVLERQRARMRWQQEELQSFYDGSEFSVYSVPTQASQIQCFQGLMGGDSMFGEVAAAPVKPDPSLENGWSDLGKFDMACTAGFGACGYGNGSGFELNYPISRTSSCQLPAAEDNGREAAVLPERMTSVTGIESFKKRKAEKMQNTKVPAAEDENRDKRIKGCAEEGESKITEQNSNKNNTNKSNRETSADTSKDNSKASEVQKPDYIHVRARRGQATDSHSLAERVRREKISERMKYLQDLVPGCNKITGKAGMLDEIINYVQSLQRQVEFLSMKLAAVNPRLDFNMDNMFAKEVFPACTSSFPTIGMSSEMGNPAFLQFNPVQQVVSCCGLEMGINPTDMGHRRTISAPESVPETIMDSSCFTQIQPSSAWDADLHNLYNVEFDQGRSTSFASQPFTGSIEASNIKMEM